MQARKSRKQTAKSDIEQFFDLVFAATVKQAIVNVGTHSLCKNLGFSWPIHSSLASSAKLDIFKVDKTQMVEVSWEPSYYSIQTSPGCPRPK